MAQDGESALERIVQALPDAVVLDVGLPGIDGLDVCRRVHVGELKARLRALLRRAKPKPDSDAPDWLSFEELRLDPGRHGAQVGETFVELTRTEYQLLELLLLNRGWCSRTA
ncbi:MAG TPA: hypothetical protein VK680_01935 [Solirubrobacteraceae bacterium]|nr:hypothetical protein [Solirubrobacteraceae bacterium]